MTAGRLRRLILEPCPRCKGRRPARCRRCKGTGRNMTNAEIERELAAWPRVLLAPVVMELLKLCRTTRQRARAAASTD